MLVMRRNRLRVERGVDRRDRGAEARRHLLQHVVAPDAEFVADDLHVGVAVAEMPGELHECERRPGVHLSQGFRLAGNQDNPAIVEHDAVAVAQRDGLVEIQQEFRSALALEHDAAAMPVARIEHDKVDGGGGFPEARAANSPAALHGRLPSAHNGANKIVWESNMPKPSTLQGKYSAAGEGNVYARANVATCKITASDTDGTFEIFDEQCKPGFESRLHMHTKSFQVCYVVDGAGEFQLGDQVFHAKKGACVNIPPGVPHKVRSKEGMRMLMVYSPPGLEGMMAAMKALSPQQLADGALTSKILAEHDTVVLGEGTGSKGSGSVLG
jgi:mannose-6-phosphate isomerase-like protein (cupin superfamily)